MLRDFAYYREVWKYAGYNDCQVGGEDDDKYQHQAILENEAPRKRTYNMVGWIE